MEYISVLVFEDNALVRQGLEAILNVSNGYRCVGAFPDCNNWEMNIKERNPQVILMDIEMPGISGIEATEKIKKQYPDIRILIQTVFDDSKKIFKALCAGASGYLLKNEPPSKILESVTEVYEGGAPMSPAIAKTVIDYFATHNITSANTGSEDYHLSEREKEILGMMVRGYNLKTIAEKCFISYETVRTHVKKIYKKLHVTSSFGAIHKANDEGLV